MSIVTCHLMGGLGNQLFQIATTIAYATNSHKTFIFPLLTDQKQTRKKSYDNNILSLLPRSTNFIINHKIKENGHPFQNIPILNKNVCLEGYFQSWKYFNNHKKVIKMFLNLKINKIYDYNFDNSLSIHVRRGDYLSLSQIHYNLPISFYEKSLNLFSQSKIDNIYIFSDDIEWCKSNVLFKNLKNVIFIDEEDYICLFFMTQCNNHIIANSSFSWWGAYLKEKEGSVICPTKWFEHKGPEINIKDIALEEWILLNP